MPHHDPQAFLLDMALYAKSALDFAGDLSPEELEADLMRLYAVIYALQTVGEAANRLGRAYHLAHPGLPWKDIIGFRNRVVHGYDAVNIPILHNIIHSELEKIITFVESNVRPPSS